MPDCFKIRYDTEREASKARKALIKKFGDPDRAMKPYFCQQCQCYHLGHPWKTQRINQKKKPLK